MAKRTFLAGLVALLGGLLLPFGGGTAHAALSEEIVYRRIHTPVDGPVS